jgi:ATP-dependent exoDNAse (exonuclease V) beta subunit
MKVKEITAGISGVIPVASYENLRPSFSMTVEILENEDHNEAMENIKKFLHEHFEREVNRAKSDLIEKQNSNIKFYEINGKKYPSVTNILGWEKDWKITEDELCQYGSRGTIVHKLIEIYLKENRWADPLEIEVLEEHINILMSGSLKLTWENCSYKESLESLRDKIKVIELEKVVVNEEHMFAGRLDLLCTHEEDLTVGDFKTGSGDMAQLAAYASCIEGVKKLMLVPVGPTDNKCGFKKPNITTNIEKEFKAFLKARARFRERFGV